MWSSSSSQHPILQFLLSFKTNIEPSINEIVDIQTQSCIFTYTKEKKILPMGPLTPKIISAETTLLTPLAGLSQDTLWSKKQKIKCCVLLPVEVITAITWFVHCFLFPLTKERAPVSKVGAASTVKVQEWSRASVLWWSLQTNKQKFQAPFIRAH